MKEYKDCNLWEKSRILLFSVYRITEHFSAMEKKCFGDQLQNYCIENLTNIVKCGGHRRNRNVELLKNSICVMNKFEQCLQHACGLRILNTNDYQYLNQELAEIRMLIKMSDVRREMSDVRSEK